jgi:hypothetical protein
MGIKIEEVERISQSWWRLAEMPLAAIRPGSLPAHRRFPAWILLVLRPFGRILRNVTTDPNELFLVADDVFVVVALPEGDAGGIAEKVDVFGCGGFERPNDGCDGSSCGPGWAVVRSIRRMLL